MLIAGAIGSLRQLSELQYPKIVESVSRMEAILREDPAGIHARSDFATRDQCRRVVEACGAPIEIPPNGTWRAWRWSWRSRPRPAAVNDASRTTCWMRDCRSLKSACGAVFHCANGGCDSCAGIRRSCISGVSQHSPRALRAPFVLAAHAAAEFTPLMLLFWGCSRYFPASELATYLLQMFVTWFCLRATLPKMSFEGHTGRLPHSGRGSDDAADAGLSRGEIEKLEVRYLGQPGCLISVSRFLADFTDAEEPEMPKTTICSGWRQRASNSSTHVTATGSSRSFIDRASWCETESRWIGWERKRGKLEELNRLLNGEESGILYMRDRCRRQSVT